MKKIIRFAMAPFLIIVMVVLHLLAICVYYVGKAIRVLAFLTHYPIDKYQYKKSMSFFFDYWYL